MVTAANEVCRAEDMPHVLDHLNFEFIHSRGRQTLLQDRFPHLLSAPGNLLVRRSDTTIYAALAAKRFCYTTSQLIYSACMIGLVWTNPTHRRQGHMSALLTFAKSLFASEQMDFAVLWTTRPDVYAGSGWVSADCGGYARLEGTFGADTGELANHHVFQQTETIRWRHANSGVIRNSAEALSLAPPSVKLRVLLNEDAFAYIGIDDSAVYVLDVTGGKAQLNTLWSRLSSIRPIIHVNAKLGATFDAWLQSEVGFRLHPKPLTMWISLSAAAQSLSYSSIYIPFLDRI